VKIVGHVYSFSLFVELLKFEQPVVDGSFPTQLLLFHIQELMST